MPVNVLLRPLLGGYVFLRYWNRTRFSSRRYSGERLLLHAAIAGISFLAAAFLLTRLLNWGFPGLGSWWRRMLPFPYSGTAFLSLVLGGSLWVPLNWLSRSRMEAANRVIEETGDYLETLLVRAIRRTKPVSVTLKSGKTYIGFVVGNIDPSFDRRFVSLLPLQSGYRNGEHQLVINTDYARVYERINDEGRTEPELDELMRDFIIVLPVGEIQSVNLFDRDAYRLFDERPGLAA
ncbi:MAG TPA: hypothetical protein VFQ76_19185 [Longimicrobiaceae bacterium]|nr:hypothetical protein [Longimicrobiaceae bacterium]